ncbi:MAG: 1-acyl-sn-glycerol-3-phosphate acyltransferase [Thermoanaerobaculia bacterium]|nr:1-acyl-sn-glycerol-3-phosphate acyltransferase [Thermoanaerobaculia bacterium]
MRSLLPYAILRALQLVSRFFYRHEYHWVGDPPPDGGERWQPYRLVAILNHTSLMEALLAGQAPKRFLRRMAKHATVPIADITINRPVIGWFWKSVAGNVVSVSRERDHTWEEVLSSVDDPDSMVIILPEGRMKRGGGLDKHGRKMRVRGGIADLLNCFPEGKLLLCYSQGLHHIQIPDEGPAKLFKTVRCRFEELDIATYRNQLKSGLDPADDNAFRRRVIQDLTERRDRYCTSDVGGTDRPKEWEGRDDIVRPGKVREREMYRA